MKYEIHLYCVSGEIEFVKETRMLDIRNVLLQDFIYVSYMYTFVKKIETFSICDRNLIFDKS